jgi:integrase
MSGSGGGVREKANGRWEGRGRVNGRDISVSAATKREAQERLRAALSAADSGIRPVASRTTVAAFLEEWLETSVTQRCRPSTVSSYRETVIRYIVPAIGKRQLAKLEPLEVSRMLSALTERGDLSPTTVRYAYAVLRIALGRGLKEGRVMRNVATLVDPPAKVRHELQPLTGAEARSLIAGTAEDRNGPLYALAITTGMRQGELLALRWVDIDLVAGTVAVRHTLQRRTHDLAEPKTDRARRTLRLGVSAIATLRDHRNRQRLQVGRSWTEDAYVFTSRAARPLDSRNVTQDLQAALARLGLPRQRFHDLRHAYATLMLEDGEDLAVVSRSLGHADLSTTADVYAHLTPAMLERAAVRMDRILGQTESG